MKNFILLASLLLTLNVFADIEHTDNAPARPSEEEIARNRACFQDLATQGCGDPGEDPQQFRSCMSNVYSTLDKHCQDLMSTLYGK